MVLKGSDAKAVETLSHPDPGMLVCCRHELIAAGRGGPEAQAQAQEDIYALVEKMIASFQELGASGQIIGLGIYSWTGLRQPIPPEFWPDLKFDFEANKASNDKFSYSHVTIDQDDPAGSQGDFVAWLTQHRPENSKAAKKMLAADARAEFGGDYTERAFNEAYREVYQRRRGRPRGSEK
jgi:hypothetical protein